MVCSSAFLISWYWSNPCSYSFYPPIKSKANYSLMQPWMAVTSLTKTHSLPMIGLKLKLKSHNGKKSPVNKITTQCDAISMNYFYHLTDQILAPCDNLWRNGYTHISYTNFISLHILHMLKHTSLDFSWMLLLMCGAYITCTRCNTQQIACLYRIHDPLLANTG